MLKVRTRLFSTNFFCKRDASVGSDVASLRHSSPLPSNLVRCARPRRRDALRREEHCECVLRAHASQYVLRRGALCECVRRGSAGRFSTRFPPLHRSDRLAPSISSLSDCHTRSWRSRRRRFCPLAPLCGGGCGARIHEHMAQALHFPPWFAKHQLGALDVRVPDVRNAQPLFRPAGAFRGTWASRNEIVLDSNVKADRSSFQLDVEESKPSKVEGSLQHRTLSARIRFVDFSHHYETGKRARDGTAAREVVHRSAKYVRAKFNAHGGGFRFVWNKAIQFIRSFPASEQGRWYNKNKLHPILLTMRAYSDRAIPDQKKTETTEEYETRVAEVQARRQRMKDDRTAFAEFKLLGQNPWLGDLDAQVLQEALKSLEEAFRANLAAQRAARQAGRGVRRFKIGFKSRSKPSAWTFTLPAQAIVAEHVPRPTHGKAVRGQPQPQPQPRTWTKLTLPAAFGGSDKSVGPNSRARFPAVVYLTSKVDITPEGRLLADAKFTRDRLGHWNMCWQRAPLKVPKAKPLKTAAFLDPGSRTGNTAYFPGGVKSLGGAGAVVEYMAGDGGATRLFELCLKVDKLVSESREIKPPQTRNSLPREPLSPDQARLYHDAKTREHRLRARIYNLVRDGHVRVVADLFSKADTVVVPVFDTHRMAKRPLTKDDPRRKINNKTVRQLFSLRHGAFRDRLRHAARTMGKETAFPGEEYTTIGCPNCLRVNAKFSGTRFTCAFCRYSAPRDVKSGLTYAIKCLRAP